MTAYRISDLINKLAEIMNDGYELVQILEMEADDDFPEHLAFEAVEYQNSTVDYEEVESIEVSDEYAFDESALYHVDVNYKL